MVDIGADMCRPENKAERCHKALPNPTLDIGHLGMMFLIILYLRTVLLLSINILFR